MILDIILYPDERLKEESLPVELFDDEFQTFVDDLEETRLAGPGAVGIAAAQVGRFQRVAIVDVSNMRKPVENHGYMVLVNPEIIAWDDYEIGREGCLSVPDFTGNVIRATAITLKAQDRYGEYHEYKMKGFEARAVQHELDHLDGRLFLDRVVSRTTDLFKRKTYKK
ncbi:MAG TPA: peptide deformylase [Leucothrix mucor]|nr:peptide deformylase [Leucothrix mucor]